MNPITKKNKMKSRILAAVISGFFIILFINLIDLKVDLKSYFLGIGIMAFYNFVEGIIQVETSNIKFKERNDKDSNQ